MTNMYHATPYDLSATGFYFTGYNDYFEKAAKHFNSYGQHVEEFEIQFIDGENAERAGPTLLDSFAAMLSFVMLFNVMPLFSFDQGHGPDFRFSDYRPHRGFVH